MVYLSVSSMFLLYYASCSCGTAAAAVYRIGTVVVVVDASTGQEAIGFCTVRCLRRFALLLLLLLLLLGRLDIEHC